MKLKIGGIYTFVSNNETYSKILIIIQKFNNGIVVTYSLTIKEEVLSNEMVQHQIENNKISFDKFATYTSKFLKDMDIDYIGELNKNSFEKIVGKMKE